MNLNRIFNFYFLNKDISITPHVIDLKCFEQVLNVFLGGRVSQNFDLCLRFFLCKKSGNFLYPFSI